MILFDVLPKDILILLLLECDTSTLSNIRCVNQSLRILIDCDLKVMINDLLRNKYEDFYIKKSTYKECKICKRDTCGFPNVKLYSAYYQYSINFEEFEKTEILQLLRSNTIVYKEDQRKLREEREKERKKKYKEWLEKGKNNGISIYDFGIYPEEHQPSGGRYNVYTVCCCCALHKV